MTTATITTVSAACAVANEWLITHLPDRFAAGIPTYDPPLMGWQIPVWLAYPHLVPLGSVGTLLVDALQGGVKTYPPIAEMKEQALKLYERHREHIEALFFKQETHYSCAPACLRMVLSALEMHV